MARQAAALLLLGALGACGSGAPSARSTADLTHPFLGPDQSSWLIGPVAQIATQEEIDAYLALRDEAEATLFIEQFWARRDPNPDVPGNPVRETFDARSAEADRMYSEAGFRGRRTARGTIFVVYGPPSGMDFEVSSAPGSPPIEVWEYKATAPLGLDGRKPSSLYRFIKRGDLTVQYVPRDPVPLQRPE
ncbi:MAG TPA: hypothetical protein DD490_09055 [Acidobacteria bacterium]|nr:hypothetical protein [Acidobacteriota bacterium]